MIGEVEGFGAHLERLFFVDNEVSRHGDVELEQAGTFQIVVAQSAITSPGRLGRNAGAASLRGAPLAVVKPAK